MKARFAIALIAIAMLCACAMAENTSVNQTGISGNTSERNPFQDAVQEYDYALQLDPGNASAWLGKAQISQILGNHMESQEYFQKALDATNETLKDNSQDAKAWQAMGVALAGLARNEEAISALERSIEISDQRLQENPEDADSWWLKAVSYEALYMDYAAIRAYEKVIELNSAKSVGAWIRIADILFVKANGYNESVEAFNKAIKLMPDNASWAGGVVSDQGNSILRTDVWRDDYKIFRVTIGSYNKSIKEFDFIQQIVSRPASTWLFRDNSIGFLKTSTEFVALANNRLQKNTEDWYKTSQQLFKNASYEESVKALNRAIELDPQNATLWDAKASSLGIAASFGGNRSQYNESLLALDKAIELDTGNSTLHIHKGFFIASLADLSGHQNKSLYEEAIKEFDEAIELDPKNKEAWNYKASVLDTRLNKSAEALLAYDKAIELDGENAVDNESLSNAWSGKGTALAKLGRYNESFEAFDKAIEQYPLDAMGAQTWYRKGIALQALGRISEADAAFAEDKELGYQG